MKIGVDGRELVGQPTGIGRYVASLCTEWASMPAAKNHAFVVYSDSPITSLPTNVNGLAGGAGISFTVIPGAGDTWWEQTLLADSANDDHLDVFFGPAYSLPIRLRLPSVVTLHDISFATHPEWFGWREGIRRRWQARQSALAAETVITVSEFSRREIVEHYDVAPSRVRVIHNGINSATAAAVAENRDQMILYVGALFNRRNLPTLIAAFAHVVHRLPDAELVIVGPDRTHPKQDLQSLAAVEGVAAKVKFHPYVNDRELNALYRRAGIFAFLSEYEGFGMTPLEALAAGVPAVVGDTEVGREIYGDAACHISLDNTHTVAQRLIDLLTNQTERAAFLDRASVRLKRFHWSHTAASTLAVLEEAAKR